MSSSGNTPLGQVIYAAVKPIFKIYFIMAIGFYLAKRNILSVPTCRDISDAIVTAIMPCLIFNNVVTNLQSSDIKNLGIIFFEGTILFALGVTLSYAVSLLTNSPKRWLGGLLSVGLFPNISDLPIAYMQTLSKGGGIFSASEGDKGVAYVCIFLASQVFYQFSLGLYQLIEWDFRDELKPTPQDEEKNISTSTSASSASDKPHAVQERTGSNENTNNSSNTNTNKATNTNDNLTNTNNDPTNTNDKNSINDNNNQDDNDDQTSISSSNSEYDRVARPQSLHSDNNSYSSREGSQPSNQHNAFYRRHQLTQYNSNPRSSISSASTSGIDGDTEGSRDVAHSSGVNPAATSTSNTNNNPTRTTSRRSRRRPSTTSANTNYYSLNPVSSRAVDLRNQKSQDITDVIHEYSEFDRLRTNEVRRCVTGTSEVGVEQIDVPQENVHGPGPAALTTVTSTKSSSSSVHPETRGAKFKRHSLRILKNFAAPNSVSLISSIIIAMAPPLKALFVTSKQVSIHPAPDNQPPLSFIMDLVSYVGAASVPLGLLLLGATISRLKIKAMPPGFWKTAVGLTATRLIILPIIGVGITTGFYKAGWYGDDKLVRFISVLEFGLPSATALVYFTAFYTDPHSEDHLQMDCLAVVLIAQYLVVWFSLPFLVTFSLKVSLGY